MKHLKIDGPRARSGSKAGKFAIWLVGAAMVGTVGCGGSETSPPAVSAQSSALRAKESGKGKRKGRRVREPFTDAKLIIEHNSTDEDTGFQGFLDGAAWDEVEIRGPNGRPVVEIETAGTFRGWGLTELFFETREPPNADVPIPDVLALLPEGEYVFKGRGAEGQLKRRTTVFTHAIPAGPEILTPEDGALIDPEALVISWNPVTKTIFNEPVEIAGYEVVVVKPVDTPPAGFSQPDMKVHVPPEVTSLNVPPQLLEPGIEYEFEVLAIEVSGNQTLTFGTFVTPE